MAPTRPLVGPSPHCWSAQDEHLCDLNHRQKGDWLRLIGFISSSDVETPHKDHPNIMSQMRDLLREMVTEPLFWPLMLVLAGMFAYLGVTY
jgi:hypothetical protein